MMISDHIELGVFLASSSAKRRKYEFTDEQCTCSGHWSWCEWLDDGPLLTPERVPGNYRGRKVCPSGCFCRCRCLVGVATCCLRVPSRSVFTGSFQAVVYGFI